jgi:transposase-like protein
VFLETAEQRCWWHKVGNVLAALTKSAHPGAKRALAEIYNADNKTLAVKAAHSNPSGTSHSRQGPDAGATVPQPIQ